MVVVAVVIMAVPVVVVMAVPEAATKGCVVAAHVLVHACARVMAIAACVKMAEMPVMPLPVMAS